VPDCFASRPLLAGRYLSAFSWPFPCLLSPIGLDFLCAAWASPHHVLMLSPTYSLVTLAMIIT
jgi:hypothetical protein